MKPHIGVLTVLVMGLGWACDSSFAGSASPSTSTPTSSFKVLVVFTTWVPDPSGSNGPEPGFGPALSGLTWHDIQRATAKVDPSGTSWAIYLYFTPRGANLFAKLTRDNVAACPGDPATGAGPRCAQRHLGIWLDLTQADIDHWADPGYVRTVSQPYDLGCLRTGSPTATCPKLVSDPITLKEIDGGQLALNGAFTQASAAELAGAISSATTGP